MACLKRGNMAETAHDISVIICAYTEERWYDLAAAVKSVQQQTIQPCQIIVVIDHKPDLLIRAQEQLKGVFVVENTEERGLSGARNSGIAVAKSEIIAFLDDDAIANSNWLLLLSEEFSDPQILGIGGKVIPLWSDNDPAWLPEEFYWVVGCTYRGLPQNVQKIRNPVGANMAFRREVFRTVGGFRSTIGRKGTHPVGCEETELCIRANQYWPQGIFLYLPEAKVFHRVSGNRTSFRYLCERCFAEGWSKAVIASYVGAKDSLSSEFTYTLRTLPLGIVRGCTQALFGHDFAGFARAGAIIAGLTLTTFGYLIGITSLKITILRNYCSKLIIIAMSPKII